MPSHRLAAPVTALAAVWLEALTAAALALSSFALRVAPWCWPLLAAAFALLLVGGFAKRRAAVLPILLLQPLVFGAAVAAVGQGALAGLVYSYAAAVAVGEGAAFLLLVLRAREAVVAAAALFLCALAASAVALFSEQRGLEVTTLGVGLGAACACARVGCARFADALDAELADALAGALARTCAAPNRLLLAAVGRTEG